MNRERNNWQKTEVPNTINYTDNSGSHADIIMTSNGSTQTKKIISIIFGACVKCDIFFKNFEGPGAAKRNSCSTNKTGKLSRSWYRPISYPEG